MISVLVEHDHFAVGHETPAAASARPPRSSGSAANSDGDQAQAALRRRFARKIQDRPLRHAWSSCGRSLAYVQPGLLLTSPDKSTETDDGYLTASEIAGLKIDADWVILSACNTAAGGAQDAEALSGLARAFFYAGARSLLVSHWEIAAESTVKLITKAIAELKADPKIDRAEVLRR